MKKLISLFISGKYFTTCFHRHNGWSYGYKVRQRFWMVVPSVSGKDLIDFCTGAQTLVAHNISFKLGDL